MDRVTIRDLHNHGEVVDRVAAGEHLTVTRDGHPVAELRPVLARGMSSGALLERRRRLPPLDARMLRREIDTVIDHSL